MSPEYKEQIAILDYRMFTPGGLQRAGAMSETLRAAADERECEIDDVHIYLPNFPHPPLHLYNWVIHEDGGDTSFVFVFGPEGLQARLTVLEWVPVRYWLTTITSFTRLPQCYPIYRKRALTILEAHRTDDLPLSLW